MTLADAIRESNGNLAMTDNLLNFCRDKLKCDYRQTSAVFMKVLEISESQFDEIAYECDCLRIREVTM
jgi:propanediol dehydratase large subunit